MHDAKTADGETPLMIAALNGCLEVVDWLHRRGASLREVLTNGNTVVHYSAASGSTDTLQYILIQEGMGHYVNSLNKVSTSMLTENPSRELHKNSVM